MAHIEKHEKDVFDGAAGYSKVEMQKLSQHLSELKSEVADETKLEAEISKELDDLSKDLMLEVGWTYLEQISKVETRFQVDGKWLYTCFRDKLAEDPTMGVTATTDFPKVSQTFFEKKLGYKAADSSWDGKNFNRQVWLNTIRYQMKKGLEPDGMQGPKTTLAILADLWVDTSAMKRVKAAKEVKSENVKVPDGTKKTVDKWAEATPWAVLLDTKDQHGNAIYKITDLKDLPTSGRTDKKVYHFVDANGRNVYDFYGPGRVDTRGDGMKNWKKDDKGNIYVGDIIVSGKKKAFVKEAVDGYNTSTERQEFYSTYVKEMKGLDLKKELQATHKDVLWDDWFKKNAIVLTEVTNKIDIWVTVAGQFLWYIRPVDYALDGNFNKDGAVKRLYDLIEKNGKNAETEAVYNAALEGVRKSKAYSFVDLFGKDEKYTIPYKAYFDLFEGGKVMVNTDKPQYISRVNDKWVEYIQFDLNDAGWDEDFNEKLKTPVTAVIDSDTGKFSEYKWKKVLAEKIKGIVASSTFKNSIE